MFNHEVHFFQENSREWQRQLRQNLGPSVYVGRFDIQHFNRDAPPGTSVFQLQKEREFAEKNYQELTERHERNTQANADKLLESKRKKDPPPPIPVPTPPPNHVICAVCREQFTNYLDHITSDRHKQGVKTRAPIFAQIDSLIEEIDDERKIRETIQEAYARMKNSERPQLGIDGGG